MVISLQGAVKEVKGIGDKTAQLLEKLQITTVEDLLYHTPAYYKDLRVTSSIASLLEGDMAIIDATITMPPRWIRRFGKFSLFGFEVSDTTDVLDINIFNLPFLYNKYEVGQKLYFYGKVKYYRGRKQMDNPTVFAEGDSPGLLPFYPLTAGVTQYNMRTWMEHALSMVKGSGAYSEAFLEKNKIQDDGKDFTYLHRPKSFEEAEAGRRSLALKELLLFQQKMALSSKEQQMRAPLQVPANIVEQFARILPFAPTDAQLRSMAEIAGDMGSDKVANRLVQGDVGSGKTAVAVFAVYAVMQSNGQSIILAPTELLAEQHAKFAREILGEGTTALLTGATGARERREIEKGISRGSIKLLVSTHAVLYTKFDFQNLELVIIDEQHRFGVEQRGYLTAQYPQAHLIVMSATPIPRSLAMILYGSADISVLDELPPGRTPVKTFLVGSHKRKDMYEWIFDRVAQGEKAYIICPLLEPSEGLDVVSVLELEKGLKELYPNQNGKIAALYGKMTAEEKQIAMERFRTGETQVLVSTTVVEVGVDVWDATIIAVENAERFGLAQLHQLRGRVGRGNLESFCYFVTSGAGLERLQILKDSNDGFEIAQKDLELRGSGEFFGKRQHGMASFRIADIGLDGDLLLESKKVLAEMRENYPEDYRKLLSTAQAQLQATFTVV